MSNLRIEIPKPCPASWSSMKPNDEGRHCKACDKTVIDFTAMSDEEIKTYLSGKKETRVCGRFQTHQVQRSYNVWQQKLIHTYSYIDKNISFRTVKRTALLLLTTLMTLSGCRSTTTGDTVSLESDDTTKAVSCDSSNVEPGIMVGKIAAPDSVPKIDSVKFLPPEIKQK